MKLKTLFTLSIFLGLMSTSAFATTVDEEWKNLAVSCTSYTVAKSTKLELNRSKFISSRQVEMNVAGLLGKSLNYDEGINLLDFNAVRKDFSEMGVGEDEACEQAATFLSQKFSNVRGVYACNSGNECGVIYFLQRKVSDEKVELVVLEAYHHN